MIAENWQYHNPVEIRFGRGIFKNLPDFVGSHKAVLITTPGFTKRGKSESLKYALGDSLVAIFDGVRPNPTFSSVRKAYKNLKAFKYELIIALGGGSTIDTAKAVAAIEASGNEDWIEDHLKRSVPFPESFNPKPIIAIPTTAGTGSEATMWATVWDMYEKKKYSLSHLSLYPKKAILDPELTLTLPEKETLYSGLDALSHAMEAIWNRNHNLVSDSFALKAISLVHDNLPELRHDLSTLDLRIRLLRASLFVGLAFSNTKTGLAHSISYPLTAHFGLPHGLACALPLPHLLRFNGDKAPERIKIMANALRAHATIESMKESINRLLKGIGVSSHLADYGILARDVQKIADLSIVHERADNNIANIDKAELIALLNGLF